MISKVRYEIQSDYIANVRAANKAFQHNINTPVLPSSMKGAWICKLKQTQPDKSISIFIDAVNIKYMLRVGRCTYIYYENEKKRYFYETLKYFERHLDANIPLIRVDHNCIINLKYMNSYKIYTPSKTGEVSIDDHLFKISRRQLCVFRRKLRNSSLVFAIQKLIE